jgi:hypothetical protein
VLEGKNPADVAIENRLPTLLLLNERILPQLRGNWSFPPEVREQAAGLITTTAEQLPERFQTAPVKRGP